MMVRNNLTLAVVCNQCQERMVLAHGYNSFGLTPELAGQRFGCLGWRIAKHRALCPACSGLSVLTCRQVLTDFMNYTKTMNLTIKPHPNDVPADWSGSTIFGRKRAK